MAYKSKKSFRRPRSRRSMRRRATRRPYTLVNRGIGPVSPRLITKLKWNIVFASSSSDIDQYINLNGLFQPSGSVGSSVHQPYGYDQLTPLYNRYRVFAVSYVLTATSLSGQQNTFGVVASNASTLYTNVQLFGESPRAIVKQVNGNGSSNVIRGRISLPRLNGQTKAQYMADDRFQAQVTTNPSESLTLHIGNWGSLSAGPSDATLFNLSVIYHAEFYDPNRLPTS